MPGLLTKGFCLFCSTIPRIYDIFKTKTKISRKVQRLKVTFSTLTKITTFTRGKVLTKGTAYFIFLYIISTKKCFTQFSPEMSQKLLGVKFFLFLPLKILSQKSRNSLSPSRTLKYISQEYHNYSFTYLHKAQSGLILVIYPVMQIWIHKPNAKIRKFCTLNSYEK